MYNQQTKETIVDNILLKASIAMGMGTNALQILRQIVVEELVRVNLEEITTLPAVTKKSVDEANKYVLGLYGIKKAPKLSDGTNERYLTAVKNLLTVIQNKKLVEMDSLDIEQYLRWYRTRNSEKENQNSTMNNERRFLCAFFSWMRKAKLITENPVEEVDPEQVIRKPIDFLTREEMEIMRSGCRTLRDRALIEYLRSTGVRVGEVIITKYQDIDWTTGDILVYAPKTKTYRTVFLDAIAKVHVKEYLDSRTDKNPSLFVRERGPYGTLKDSGIRSALKNIASRAGMSRRVYPHLFRHTFGTWLCESGASGDLVADMMGHKDFATSRTYYVARNTGQMRHAHNQLGMAVA